MYAAAAGALVAQSAIDNIANNLANVDTAGFKRQLLLVEAQPSSQLYRFQTDPGQNPDNRLPGVAVQVPVGSLGNGSDIAATPVDYEQGQISITGNPLSFALSGPGFFAIRDAQSGQIEYTRSGAFMRSANDLLTTVDGDPVLDSNDNPIPLPDQGKIEVDGQGNVNVDGAVSAQIATYEFNNRNALVPVGNTSYTAPATAGVRPATNTTIVQYAEEKSNSDVVRSIVDLINNERWFDANEKSISTQDDATNQAISTVGRTS